MLRHHIRSLALAAIGGIAGLVPAGHLAAQQDSVTVIPGPRYAVEPWQETFVGSDYRQLWTTPVRLPILDLKQFAGGLRPTRVGGGRQTKSLRLVNPQGREYVFRSLDKIPDTAREPAFQGTFIADLVQDQTSSLHPGGSLVLPPLLEALGILHATPQLFVMPDDPALGEFREEFAGVVGFVEERPDELEDDEGEEKPGFGGFSRIIGTDRLLERLEESPEDRLDAPAYLTARLFDLVIGDWDRHADQWRWAGVERDGRTFWLPIPRDRDYAFVDYDGLLLVAARQVAQNAVLFNEDVDVSGLTFNARFLDRVLLTELDRAAWDSVTAFVQSRLTDATIDAALRRLPPEYYEASAEEVARLLRIRRELLPAAAERFYTRLAGEVDVRATDEDDLAVIERVEDGVEVALFEQPDEGEGPGRPYYRRRFREDETREVRVYLHGGDDRAVVRGRGDDGPVVRVIGGGGDDVLADSAAILGNRSGAAFYDDRGDNRFETGPRTVVDRSSYEEPEQVRTLSGETFRDWGLSRGIRPHVDYQGTDGLIVGGGPVYTRYGFRKLPYAARIGARFMVGLGSGRLATDLRADVNRTNSRVGYTLYALASQLENIRFFGFGNETLRDGSSRRYTVRQDQLLASAAVRMPLVGSATLSLGPVAKYTNPDFPEDSPIDRDFAYGSSGVAQVGFQTEAAVDTRDRVGFPRSGVLAVAGASAYPAALDIRDAFTEAHLEARTYLPVFGESALALRAGGKKVWGTFPFHEGAFLGGSRTVRGFTYQRFAGDAMLFGNAELRVPVTPATLIIRGTLGVLALGDVGRVWYADEESDQWHTAAGGGVWFNTRIRNLDQTVTVLYARGESDRVYLKLGIPF